MRSRYHMSTLLVAALALAGPVAEHREEPPRPRPRHIGEGERLSRRQKKRQRIAERKALKAGVAGSKLAKKAARGAL